MNGKIIKGIGGFYYVADENGSVHECKAKGTFRNEGIKPLVGDDVLFERNAQTGQKDNYGLITEILPRKNVLLRPAVSNIDVLLLVISGKNPKADLMLLDKLLMQAQKQEILPFVCINKIDIGNVEAREIAAQYATAFETLLVSAKTGQGIERLKKELKGKCVCLAGQSAAGKSSLINAVDETVHLKTGGLSKKTARGKHTTRQTELLYLSQADIYIVDTPGFSAFEVEEALPEEITRYYPEFFPFLDECKYSGCLHINEPDCGVKTAVQKGYVSKARYERYVKLVQWAQEHSNTY
ncbi:MAG: ribosome small subunit-dependent GTPase A [Christensenellaceae bacterium]|jgi:ribosome biogenesis GTPase